MKRSGSTDRREEGGITLTPVLWWWRGWNSVRWSECRGGGGGGPERWMSVERHSKEPQVAHCSPAAAPASPPPSSSLPGNRTPLKASARVIQREEGEVDVWVCVCVCVCVCVFYVTKKVFLLSTYTNLARYFLPRPSFIPPADVIWKLPFTTIQDFNVKYINCSKMTDWCSMTHHDRSNWP